MARLMTRTKQKTQEKAFQKWKFYYKFDKER